MLLPSHPAIRTKLGKNAYCGRATASAPGCISAGQCSVVSVQYVWVPGIQEQPELTPAPSQELRVSEPRHPVKVRG